MKKASSSFLKKRTKKLLLLAALGTVPSLRAKRSNLSLISRPFRAPWDRSFSIPFLRQVFALSAFLLTFHFGLAARHVEYEPTKVHLSGFIVYQQFYGPPNFGEDPKTDKKVNVIELKLDTPIDVAPGPQTQAYAGKNLDTDSFNDVTVVGLIDLRYPALGLDKLAGHHVTIIGQLFEQQDMLQFNQILMEVSTVIQ